MTLKNDVRSPRPLGARDESEGESAPERGLPRELFELALMIAGLAFVLWGAGTRVGHWPMLPALVTAGASLGVALCAGLLFVAARQRS